MPNIFSLYLTLNFFYWNVLLCLNRLRQNENQTYLKTGRGRFSLGLGRETTFPVLWGFLIAHAPSQSLDLFSCWSHKCHPDPFQPLQHLFLDSFFISTKTESQRHRGSHVQIKLFMIWKKGNWPFKNKFTKVKRKEKKRNLNKIECFSDNIRGMIFSITYLLNKEL